LIKEYSAELSENEQKEKIAMMAKHGFPQLSPGDMNRASAASRVTLMPMKDLLDWVFSLLDEQEHQLTPPLPCLSLLTSLSVAKVNQLPRE